jgi:RNA polymerase sigma factor (sigma-70 family)
LEATDAALVERALRGDDAAFAQLMARHKAWVHQFIRRYVSDQADAYDVLQETFFASWRALRKFDPERPFEFWLRRIALNKCRDRKRRETARRLVAGSLDAEGAIDVVDHAPGPVAMAEGHEELSNLERHVGSLPRALMEPLLLTSIEGLTQEEAGRLLGVSAKAIENKIYRARVRLLELCGRRSREKRG